MYKIQNKLESKQHLLAVFVYTYFDIYITFM